MFKFTSGTHLPQPGATLGLEVICALASQSQREHTVRSVLCRQPLVNNLRGSTTYGGVPY